MPTILVTDGDERAALAVVRSLGRAGHEVYVTSTSGRSIAGASRWCAGEFQTADPLALPELFLEEVSEVSRDTSARVVIPVTEASLLVTLPQREAFEPAILPFPEAKTFLAISDKSAVLGRARDLGIPQPSLAQVSSATEPWGLETRPDVEQTLVLKPARSVVEHREGRAKTSVVYADDEADAAAKLRSMDPSGFPVLLQRRIRGPGVGVFLLIWDGEVLASFAHRRLREKPPSGGVSVLRESIEAPPDLLESSIALLRSFGWQGVAMVEYKQEASSGEYYLMEVNGRFWGSLQLAIDAGVDFPRLLVSAAMGAPPSAVSEYRPGVRTRWLLGDIDHLVAHVREKARGPSQGRAAGILQAIRAFLLAFLPPVRQEVLRLSDPLPAYRECVGWVTSLIRRNDPPDSER
jgi:predicted ATP-grasp superfamily ATP-dependent carboligase